MGAGPNTDLVECGRNTATTFVQPRSHLTPFIGMSCAPPKVPTCYPSCTLAGLVANCASRHLHWVPALPPNITHLYLEFNYISEINSSALRGYDQLQQIDLGKQNVQLTIRNNSFFR